MNMTESEYNLAIAEGEMGAYIRVYRDLQESFRAQTRMVLLHVENDFWELRLIGLTSREWLEFCANVYADLPSGSEPEEEVFPEPHPGALVGADTENKEKGPAEEDDEEAEGDEAEDASGDPAAREVRRKVKVINKAIKDIADRKASVQTGDRNVTVETV
jgi:hypothetical protein